MLKKFIILLFMITSCFYIFSQDMDENDNKKKDKKKNKKNENKDKIIKLEVDYYADVKLDFVDTSDDPNGYDPYLNKNSPKSEQGLYLFFKLNPDKLNGLIFGPYLDDELSIRCDHHRKNRQFYLEKLKGITETGINLGYDISYKNKELKGSKIVFSFPVFMDYESSTDINDKSLFPVNFFIGSRIGMDMDVGNQFVKFGFSNYMTFAGNAISQFKPQGDSGFYFKEENELELSGAPFNLINNKVDIWFCFDNFFSVEYKRLVFEVVYKLKAGIEWKGFKYIHLGWDFFSYRAELKLPENNFDDGYDQLHLICMDLWVKFRYEFFSFEIEYRPPLYELDRIWVNTDSVKEHTLLITTKLKI